MSPTASSNQARSLVFQDEKLTRSSSSSLSTCSGHLNPTSPNVCPCFVGGKINREKKICDSSCVEMSLYDEDSYYVAAIVRISLFPFFSPLRRALISSLLLTSSLLPTSSLFPILSSSGHLRPTRPPLPSRPNLARRSQSRRSRFRSSRSHLLPSNRLLRSSSGSTRRSSTQARYASWKESQSQPCNAHLPHWRCDGCGEVQRRVESVWEGRVRNGIRVSSGESDRLRDGREGELEVEVELSWETS